MISRQRRCWIGPVSLHDLLLRRPFNFWPWLHNLDYVWFHDGLTNDFTNGFICSVWKIISSRFTLFSVFFSTTLLFSITFVHNNTNISLLTTWLRICTDAPSAPYQYFVFWISGRCEHPGDNNKINNNKSPKDESFVSVREEFVRPLGGRHSREARVRARFRRMRI